MPRADQLKALLKSYAQGDYAQFYAVAMQIAAQQAQMGHGKLAEELRELIDKAKVRVPSVSPIPINKPRGEVADLLSVSYPDTRLDDMVLSSSIRSKLERVIREHKTISEIRSFSLSPRKKLLLVGKPGTGKTLTASALAGELRLPLFIVRLDRLITRFMGETASQLRLVFDAIAQTRAVYLFDEFDSIGSERGMTNDVGEMRRVVNSFLQMVEQDTSDSLILAATNHVQILDSALFRRFDDVIEYDLPNVQRTIDALKAKTEGFKKGRIDWDKLGTKAKGLSYGDLTHVAENAIKDVIIHGRYQIEQSDLDEALKERKNVLRQQDIRS